MHKCKEGSILFRFVRGTFASKNGIPLRRKLGDER